MSDENPQVRPATMPDTRSPRMIYSFEVPSEFTNERDEKWPLVNGDKWLHPILKKEFGTYVVEGDGHAMWELTDAGRNFLQTKQENI